MHHTLNLDALSDDQRRCFEELGIGHGDRVYIKKLSPLSDEALLSASLKLDGTCRDFPSVVRTLASLFDRRPKTIASRLRKLRCEPPSAGAAP